MCVAPHPLVSMLSMDECYMYVYVCIYACMHVYTRRRGLGAVIGVLFFPWFGGAMALCDSNVSVCFLYGRFICLFDSLYTGLHACMHTRCCVFVLIRWRVMVVQYTCVMKPRMKT